jgi:hypothetical protein
LTVCRFINDLRRWIGLVHAGKQPLFTEIASCLWGTSWLTGEADPRRFSLGETLRHFQELVSNIVHQSGLSTSALINPLLGGCRLRSLRQHHFPNIADSSHARSNVETTVAPPPLDKQEIWKEKCHRDALEAQNSEQRFDLLRRITVLMAGAIFGVILLYLCRK